MVQKLQTCHGSDLPQFFQYFNNDLLVPGLGPWKYSAVSAPENVKSFTVGQSFKFLTGKGLLTQISRWDGGLDNALGENILKEFFFEEFEK